MITPGPVIVLRVPANHLSQESHGRPGGGQRWGLQDRVDHTA